MWESNSNVIIGFQAYVQYHVQLSLLLSSLKIPTKSLVELDLSHWPICDRNLVTLSESKIYGLQSLKLQYCKLITDKGLSCLFQGWITKQNSSVYNPKNLCKCNLLSLDLTGCCNLTDFSCYQISDRLHQLRSLILNDCTKISDRGICSVMDSCKYLVTLKLRNMILLRDEGILAVRQNLIMMKMLRILGEIIFCFKKTLNLLLIHQNENGLLSLR